MPGLPLLKIPYLAQIEILKHVDTFDLISLSFCSEKARVLVGTRDVQLKRLEFQFHYLHDLTIVVNRTLKIMLENRRQGGARSEVTCSEIRGFRAEPVWKLLGNTRDFVSSRELLTGHFMKTFRRIEAISVYNSYNPIQDIPVWKYTKAIESICFQFLRHVVAPKEDVQFLLDELTVQHLEFRSIVVEGFRYSRGFQQKSVNIAKATFVDFDAILNSQSEKIHLLSIERPTTAQVNTLLNFWMSMEKMQNLRDLTLAVDTYTPYPINFLREVLNGIVHESRSQHIAMIRRINGRVAEITTDSFFDNVFKMHLLN